MKGLSEKCISPAKRKSSKLSQHSVVNPMDKAKPRIIQI
jgi:hypothetical protein